MNSAKKIVIGLTGGIGSGKTLIAQLFADFGIEIIDTDKIAHDIVSLGSEVLAKIVNHFGDKVLNIDGSLNRSLMRKIIFNDEADKHWLENLLHPIIYKQMYQQIQKSTSPYCIVIIPLLIETHIPYPIDRILVVDTDEELQIQRVMQRDDVKKEDVLAIIRTQATREERLKVADDVISNASQIAELAQQVANLHKKYLKISSKYVVE